MMLAFGHYPSIISRFISSQVVMEVNFGKVGGFYIKFTAGIEKLSVNVDYN